MKFGPGMLVLLTIGVDAARLRARSFKLDLDMPQNSTTVFAVGQNKTALAMPEESTAAHAMQDDMQQNSTNTFAMPQGLTSLAMSSRQNMTAKPYVLDRCTEIKEVYGNADYMGKDPMTLDVCYTFCNTRGAFYFGVTKGTNCWCGSMYQAKIGGAVICDSPCAGDKEIRCGGKYATSVYIMGKGPCDKVGKKGCRGEHGQGSQSGR